MRLSPFFLLFYSGSLLADAAVPTMKMHVFEPVQNTVAQAEPVEHGMKMHVFADEKQVAQLTEPGADQPRASVDSGFDMDVQVGTGYQHDTLSWSVAAPSGSPNPLTETSWTQNMWGVNSEILFSTPWNVVLKANGGYAWTFDGIGNESSYLRDDRNDPFSSVNSSADGSTAWEASVAIGYAFKFAEADPVAQFNLTPLVGYQWQEQSLLLKNSVQSIPAFTPINSSLSNRYIARWQGPWLGFDTDVVLFEQHQLFSSFSYHWADYSAVGQWQQSQALQQPTSFTHQANANAYLASIGYRYIADEFWSVHVVFNYQHWESVKGTEDLYFSSGQTIQSQLNPVKRQSFAGNMGVRFAF